MRINQNSAAFNAYRNLSRTNDVMGVGFVQATDGALEEVHTILQRMRDLAVGAANSTSDGQAEQAEVAELLDKLDALGANAVDISLIDLTTDADAAAAIATLDDAIAENFSAAQSRARDTDMAQEMVSFTRHQILMQAGTAMLAQANQVPRSVLALLR